MRASNRILSGSLASLGCALTMGACFFTDVINEAPVPGIRPLAEGTHYVGDVLQFDATKTTDDVGGDLRATWRAFSCVGEQVTSCETIKDLQGRLDTVFEVEIATHESLTIQLHVADDLGAMRDQPDLLSVEVSNHAPSLDLQVSGYREGASGPFVLYRGINLVAVSGGDDASIFDHDGDAVSLKWQLLPPAASQTSARSFAPVGDYGYSLVPDVSGEWSVVVQIDDAYGGTDEVRKDFFVGPDGPPCIEVLEPDALDDSFYQVDSADGPRRFSVLSVTDALDPFPVLVDDDPALGESTFRWLMQAPGEVDFIEISGHEASSYLVDPLIYSPGDRLALRVEVRDRVVGPERQLPCADDVWSCSLVTASQCPQRKTWGVEIQ